MVSTDKTTTAAAWPILVLPVLILALLGGAWWLNRPAVRTPEEQAAPPRKMIVGTAVWPEPRPGGYVGSEACTKCHSQIAETYAQHPMYRSAGRTPGSDDVEDFEHGTEFTFADGRTYRVVKEDDGIYHHESLRDKEGELIYDESAKIAFFIGSGTRGKSYAIDRGGILVQSPISWYSTEHKWDMSPGYTHHHVRFGRRIPDQCVICHAGRTTIDEEREHVFPEPVLIEAAIGCERCHGPGEQHVRLHESTGADKKEDSIVNPAKLSDDRREAVCYQCHLIGKFRFARYGRTFDDFRPGDRLDDVWSTLVAGTGVRGDRKTKAVSHVEQMRDSVCFKKSNGSLGCVSCHDPHSVPSKSTAEEYYRERCLTCHADKGCSLPAEKRTAAPANDSCIHCHMPRLTAHDIAHASQTDHRLLRKADDDESSPYGAEGAELVLFDQENSSMPEWERERALAVAKVHRAQESGYAGSRDAEAAEQALRDIIAIAPDDSLSWNTLGSVLELRQEWAGALQAWQRALDLKPQNERALDALSSIYQKTGDYEHALEYLDRLIKLLPFRSRDHARRAMMLSEMGRMPEALAEAETALELDPTDRFMRRWIIEAAQRSGNLETSRRHADIQKRMGLN
ncbi:MAG TPA: tetratricopeptide repeat protein [Pirellulales bacterium]|nr:tetratricopeptide repeat protein [Pirellulales bacterium]